MEVVVPMKDFHFDSTASTPYVSAPSSPLNYYPCHYGSAPTSPTRAAAIYASASMVPFNWEDDAPEHDDDFEFEFSGQLKKGELTAAADELFDQGKIRPLIKPPPPLLYAPNSFSVSSPRSPKGPGLFSPPRHRNNNKEATGERGRVPSPSYISSSSRSRKGSRSLSPMRGNGDRDRSLSSFMASPNNNNSASAAAATKSKKWRLRDFLLFRSASEGRATGNTRKDPLRKYTIMPSSDSRNSSFRSTDSSSSHGGGSSMRRMTPHEKHYTSNRAATEELKKKTALPFGRHGFFGCLRYNTAVQSIARGLQSSSALNRSRQ